MNLSTNVVECLQDTYEFLENYADADHDGFGYVPNKAMLLCSKIEDILRADSWQKREQITLNYARMLAAAKLFWRPEHWNGVHRFSERREGKRFFWGRFEVWEWTSEDAESETEALKGTIDQLTPGWYWHASLHDPHGPFDSAREAYYAGQAYGANL